MQPRDTMAGCSGRLRALLGLGQTRGLCLALKLAPPRPMRWAHAAPASSRAGSGMRTLAAAEGAAPAAAVEGAAPAGEPKIAKRKLALHIGYVGTGFKGLQVQRTTAPDATIESTLERALFNAGMILESNMGCLTKLRWTRSSRTDKSVHSLATVISTKLECDPDSFEADPEGVAIAAAINASLPPEIRVFSVQRVNKSFSARSECVRRTYRYLLPASALGLALDGGPEDRARLALLEDTWRSFQGSHPFHNYTRRRLYRRAPRPGVAASAGVADEEEEEEEGVEEEGVEEGSEGEAADDGSAAPAPAPSAKGLIRVEWKGSKDEKDAITTKHYRYMEACSVGPLGAAVPGGRPCVELSVRGASFMLHQIRHMVGTAVAVARGHLPPELAAASLSAPARVNLPLAPPSTLYLAESEFSPFRRSWEGTPGSPVISRWTGASLSLRRDGAAAQCQFEQEQLLPALDPLLEGREWEEWVGWDLERIHYSAEDLEALLAAHAAWRAELAQRKLDKAAAAAAAGGGAAAGAE